MDSSLFVRHVVDRPLERGFRVEPTRRPMPGPDPLGRVACFTQTPRRPRLALPHHTLRRRIGPHDEMHMVRPDVQRMNMPPPMVALGPDHFIDDRAMPHRPQRGAREPRGPFPVRRRRLIQPTMARRPTPTIPRQPRPIGGPSNEEVHLPILIPTCTGREPGGLLAPKAQRHRARARCLLRVYASRRAQTKTPGFRPGFLYRSLWCMAQ
jgi:hypothetical protein